MSACRRPRCQLANRVPTSQGGIILSGADNPPAPLRRHPFLVRTFEHTASSSHSPLLDACQNLRHDLRRELGGYISRKIASVEWGDGVVDELAPTIAREYPGQRGLIRPNLAQTRQFFEGYKGDANAPALLRQLPSPHHLVSRSSVSMPLGWACWLELIVPGVRCSPGGLHKNRLRDPIPPCRMDTPGSTCPCKQRLAGTECVSRGSVLGRGRAGAGIAVAGPASHPWQANQTPTRHSQLETWAFSKVRLPL